VRIARARSAIQDLPGLDQGIEERKETISTLVSRIERQRSVAPALLFIRPLSSNNRELLKRFQSLVDAEAGDADPNKRVPRVTFDDSQFSDMSQDVESFDQAGAMDVDS
jgi:hypothetical protein